MRAADVWLHRLTASLSWAARRSRDRPTCLLLPPSVPCRPGHGERMISARDARTGRASRWGRWPATGHVLWRIARPEAPSPLRGLAQAVTVETREVPAGGEPLRVVVYR